MARVIVVLEPPAGVTSITIRAFVRFLLKDLRYFLETFSLARNGPAACALLTYVATVFVRW